MDEIMMRDPKRGKTALPRQANLFAHILERHSHIGIRRKLRADIEPNLLHCHHLSPFSAGRPRHSGEGGPMVNVGRSPCTQPAREPMRPIRHVQASHGQLRGKYWGWAHWSASSKAISARMRAPAAASVGVMLSPSLWLIPSLQGIKIIPVGQK